jgi:uncharacterized protein (DUF169 family)
MVTLSEYNRYGEDLERLLRLRTSPIAVKMLEKEEDIPHGAIRPKRDRGYHIAQCQAFALSRREKDTIAMLKEDNWCPGPLMAYGIVKRPQLPDTPARESTPYESFEYGKYIGIVTAPLITTTFEPDLVIVYSNTGQLRNMLLSIRNEDRKLINSYFFPWSCAYSVVNPILTGQYWIVLPDPGEYERALGGEDEMMFSIPRPKLGIFMSDFRQAQEGHWGYTRSNLVMRPDFPLPEIYKNMFKMWGMDTGESTDTFKE